MQRLERYRVQGGRRLRCGYTTGSCAAAAAQAAVQLLLTGSAPPQIALQTPAGVTLPIAVESAGWEGSAAVCSVRKDAGDDPDITNGIELFAAVTRCGQPGVFIEGGEGVGRVTRPGLECPVGAPAINKVPQEMIRQGVRQVCRQAGYAGGVRVVLSIPRGRELAARTFNPRLGIEGGLSILGTTGIVEPMSERAVVQSIRLEMRQRYRLGDRVLAAAPGNYGERFGAEQLHLEKGRIVQCSNYIGELLDSAVELGFSGVLLIGHLGKLVKLAGGMMNTHSRYGDCRMELLAAYAALEGAGQATVAQLLSCITTDDALGLLEQRQLRQPVIQHLLDRIAFYMKARVGDKAQVGAVLFSNRYGLLGETRDAPALLRQLQEGMQ